MTTAKSNKSTRRNKSVKRTGKALVKPGNRQKTLPNEDTFWPGRNFHKEFDSKCTLTESTLYCKLKCTCNTTVFV